MLKVDKHRRICIKKDVRELELWMLSLECFNDELDYFELLEKQLIKNSSISNTIKVIRRKNILLMASFCKYEQELKIELEYGKTEYDEAKCIGHNQKRNRYLELMSDMRSFKNDTFKILKTYRRQ